LFRVPSAVQATLLFFAMLLVLRIVLRNQWVAAAAFVAVWTILKVLGSKHPGIEILTEVLIYGIAALSIVRFGLVTLAVAVFVTDSLGNVPMTSDFSRWYATTALFVPAVILVLTVWAFYAALGGQKLIKSDLLE